MKKELTFHQAFHQLSRLADPMIKRIYLRLERIQSLLRYLENPEKKFPSILIGGTSGKGSTVACLSALLQASGLKVGSTYSPHVLSVRERIQINGKWISEHDFARLFSKVQKFHPVVARDLPLLGVPTYFESITAMAFDYFSLKNVDLAVVEVGLGGKLDATNVLNPSVVILSNVEKDHTKILGNSFRKIAIEKSGIIRPHASVISAIKRKTASAVVKQECDKFNAPLFLYGRDFYSDSIKTDSSGITFTFHGFGKTIKDIRCSLRGSVQAENASCALAACFILQKSLKLPSPALFVGGLKTVDIPGRSELLSVRPKVVLDGAHNPHKINHCMKGVFESFSFRKLIILFAVKQQKDMTSMLRMLLSRASIFIATEFGEESLHGDIPIPSRKAEEIVKKSRLILKTLSQNPKVFCEPDPEAALKLAKEYAKKNDLILVTGSFYLVSALHPQMKRI